jgi:hypothetical protein
MRNPCKEGVLTVRDVIENTSRRKPKIEPEQKDTGKAKAQTAASKKRIDTIKVIYTSNYC